MARGRRRWPSKLWPVFGVRLLLLLLLVEKYRMIFFLTKLYVNRINTGNRVTLGSENKLFYSGTTKIRRNKSMNRCCADNPYEIINRLLLSLGHETRNFLSHNLGRFENSFELPKRLRVAQTRHAVLSKYSISYRVRKTKLKGRVEFKYKIISSVWVPSRKSRSNNIVIDTITLVSRLFNFVISADTLLDFDVFKRVLRKFDNVHCQCTVYYNVTTDLKHTYVYCRVSATFADHYHVH